MVDWRVERKVATKEEKWAGQKDHQWEKTRAAWRGHCWDDWLVKRKAARRAALKVERLVDGWAETSVALKAAALAELRVSWSVD